MTTIDLVAGIQITDNSDLSGSVTVPFYVDRLTPVDLGFTIMARPEIELTSSRDDDAWVNDDEESSMSAEYIESFTASADKYFSSDDDHYSQNGFFNEYESRVFFRALDPNLKGKYPNCTANVAAPYCEESVSVSVVSVEAVDLARGSEAPTDVSPDSELMKDWLDDTERLATLYAQREANATGPSDSTATDTERWEIASALYNPSIAPVYSSLTSNTLAIVEAVSTNAEFERQARGHVNAASCEEPIYDSKVSGTVHGGAFNTTANFTTVYIVDSAFDMDNVQQFKGLPFTIGSAAAELAFAKAVLHNTSVDTHPDWHDAATEAVAAATKRNAPKFVTDVEKVCVKYGSFVPTFANFKVCENQNLNQAKDACADASCTIGLGFRFDGLADYELADTEWCSGVDAAIESVKSNTPFGDWCKDGPGEYGSAASDNSPNTGLAGTIGHSPVTIGGCLFAACSDDNTAVSDPVAASSRHTAVAVSWDPWRPVWDAWQAVSSTDANSTTLLSFEDELKKYGTTYCTLTVQADDNSELVEGYASAEVQVNDTANGKVNITDGPSCKKVGACLRGLVSPKVSVMVSASPGYSQAETNTAPRTTQFWATNTKIDSGMPTCEGNGGDCTDITNSNGTHCELTAGCSWVERDTTAKFTFTVADDKNGVVSELGYCRKCDENDICELMADTTCADADFVRFDVSNIWIPNPNPNGESRKYLQDTSQDANTTLTCNDTKHECGDDTGRRNAYALIESARAAEIEASEAWQNAIMAKDAATNATGTCVDAGAAHITIVISGNQTCAGNGARGCPAGEAGDRGNCAVIAGGVNPACAGATTSATCTAATTSGDQAGTCVVKAGSNDDCAGATTDAACTLATYTGDPGDPIDPANACVFTRNIANACEFVATQRIQHVKMYGTRTTKVNRLPIVWTPILRLRAPALVRVHFDT